MTASNHGLAGALIGSVLPLPLAVPAAFVSHFVMDAIPHFGIEKNKSANSKLYTLVLAADTFIGLVLITLMVVNNHWNMLICGFVAYSPDVPIVYHFFRTGSTNGNHHWPFKWRLFTLPHHEYEWGIFVEIGLFAIMLPFFVGQLN